MYRHLLKWPWRWIWVVGSHFFSAFSFWGFCAFLRCSIHRTPRNTLLQGPGALSILRCPTTFFVDIADNEGNVQQAELRVLVSTLANVFGIISISLEITFRMIDYLHTSGQILFINILVPLFILLLCWRDDGACDSIMLKFEFTSTICWQCGQQRTTLSLALNDAYWLCCISSAYPVITFCQAHQVVTQMHRLIRKLASKWHNRMAVPVTSIY